MKNYELLNELMKMPANANVEICVAGSSWTGIESVEELGHDEDGRVIELGLCGESAMIVDSEGNECGYSDEFVSKTTD